MFNRLYDAIKNKSALVLSLGIVSFTAMAESTITEAEFVDQGIANAKVYKEFAARGDKNAAVSSLTVFECGKVQSPDRSHWSPGVDVNVAHKMVASCYLLKHGDDYMVWDTGIPAPVANMKDGLSIAGGKINLFLDTPFPVLLKEYGVEPTDVKYLGLSHMHADHTGNANVFTNATWFIQEVEYNAAFGELAPKLNFNPKTYDKLDQNKVVKLNGYHDVFGDGSAVIIPAPGHTPGHQVLFVNLESGPIILSGDLWHFTSNYTNERVPGFNFDMEQTRASIRLVDALAKVSGAKILIQHDHERNEHVPHAPDSIH